MNDTEKNETCCAVFVTYNPKADFIYNLEKIAIQVEKVVIVDNNSAKETIDILNICIIKFKNVDIIFNNENKGIATALNQGVYFAINNQYEYILLMDQDSYFKDSNLVSLLQSARQIFKLKDIGLLSPVCSLEGNKKENYRRIKIEKIENVDTVAMNSVITSGSIYRAEIFEKIGFFVDNYFIDYVDIEFCLRLRKNGFKILTLTNVYLSHALGHPQEIFLFKIFIRNIVIHSPTRIYYKFRNRIWTYKSYFFHFPLWILLDLFRMIKELIKILFFFENRFIYVKFLLKAFWDGFVFNVNTESAFLSKNTTFKINNND